jgi:hypothetical protein
MRLIIISSALVLAAACSRTVARLSPAPGVAVVPGPGAGASTTVDGIQVIARAEAWKWNPTDLSTKVTPLLLELQNNGNREVLIRYNQIWLTDAAGHRFNVMPPYDINATVTQAYTIENPFYGFRGFAIAPYLSRWYPRMLRYRGAFAYDPAYYSPYITRYAQVQLPTVDMVQRALPEGVLSPNGHAEGFVYFEALRPDAGTVTLAVNLLDASNGSLIGTAEIPFVAR